jgi:hypothetical protein
LIVLHDDAAICQAMLHLRQGDVRPRIYMQAKPANSRKTRVATLQQIADRTRAGCKHLLMRDNIGNVSHRLTRQQLMILISQIVTSKGGVAVAARPSVFTEQGVSMLSSVLNSPAS